MTIGEPGDKYEQEANRVASQVVQQINTPSAAQSTQGKSLQRQDTEEEEIQTKPSISVLQRSPLPTQVKLEAIPGDEELQAKSILQGRDARGSREASTDVESAINSARGSGQALDAGLQRSMGQAMGADFSGVKVHTDSQSDRLNQSVQARAFTTGQDVFFRQGAYEPGSRRGQELIAHELTHVLQQSGNRRKMGRVVESTVQKKAYTFISERMGENALHTVKSDKGVGTVNAVERSIETSIVVSAKKNDKTSSGSVVVQRQEWLFDVRNQDNGDLIFFYDQDKGLENNKNKRVARTNAKTVHLTDSKCLKEVSESDTLEIMGHANTEEIMLRDGKKLRPNELAALLKEYGFQGCKSITLSACNTGEKFAKELAEALFNNYNIYVAVDGYKTKGFVADDGERKELTEKGEEDVKKIDKAIRIAKEKGGYTINWDDETTDSLFPSDIKAQFGKAYSEKELNEIKQEIIRTKHRKATEVKHVPSLI
ncbi:MAG: eCIS core domain-containing protein [Nostoc sp.]|uniref:eCIS core domain-containing protein n=1 Tax=Nostoc sp. TaxID=1180 RepID=UPI002FF7512F